MACADRPRDRGTRFEHLAGAVEACLASPSAAKSQDELRELRRWINALELVFARAAGRYRRGGDEAADEDPVAWMRSECHMTSNAARGALVVSAEEVTLPSLAKAERKDHHHGRTVGRNILTLDIAEMDILAHVAADPDRAESYLPLTPAMFAILLALVAGEKHGYAIMREISSPSATGVRIGPGTLYRSIKQLLERGLIVESGERPDPALDDERRRYYRLEHLGRRVAQAEALRLARLVSEAGARGLLADQSALPLGNA